MRTLFAAVSLSFLVLYSQGVLAQARSDQAAPASDDFIHAFFDLSGASARAARYFRHIEC